MKALSVSDCIEISSAVEDADLQEKIGPDGELLAKGKVTLTADELETCRADVQAKCERLLSGFYDEYPGEIQKRNSTSHKWAAQMTRIAHKLNLMRLELFTAVR